MFIYNVTVKVTDILKIEWLEWLQQEHVPEMIETGCFESYRIFRLLEVDDSEGPTYVIQYTCTSKSAYEKYIHSFATTMRERTYQKWGNGFIAFRTLMEQI